jgi:hypothetical protein
MFPRWKYSLFQRWFRRTLAFQKPLAFLSEIINCFTNIFDSKELKYSPKVCSCAHSTRKWQLKKKWAAIFGQRRQISHLLRRSRYPKMQVQMPLESTNVSLLNCSVRIIWNCFFVFLRMVLKYNWNTARPLMAVFQSILARSSSQLAANDAWALPSNHNAELLILIRCKHSQRDARSFMRGLEIRL